MADKITKGRDPKGEKNGQAKLRESEVIAIRADKRTQQAIADTYGVSVTTISEVKRRIWWQHI